MYYDSVVHASMPTCCLTTSAEEEEEDDDIVELIAGEVAWLESRAMLKFLYLVKKSPISMGFLLKDFKNGPFWFVLTL